jgi:hypothetical protein
MRLPDHRTPAFKRSAFSPPAFERGWLVVWLGLVVVIAAIGGVVL